ncbi:hypothetical protein BH11GEM1_BH11GEM1_06770 [soil metagenome]
MRYPLTSLVLVVMLGEQALAQQPTPSSSAQRSATKAGTRAAQREAEKLRRRLDFIPATSVSGALRGSAPIMGTTLLTSGDEQTNFQLIRRAASGQPEVHARWDDMMIVRSGTGAVVTGDSLIGSSYRAPGERVGGHFGRSYEIVIHAGDVIRIPAAVPHAVVVSGTQPLEYLLIKQRRQELPIRWFARR